MSIIKVSDYIMEFLVNHGIKDLFLVSGGGMMHLLDSAGRNPNLNLIFNLNEQASGICADSYAQYTGNLGACMLTTGPGATNAVTGCAGAWVDSTPAIFISGQCKTEQMGQLMGLRIYGAQEIAIVPCVKPITKYAITVLKKEEISYHLEKAIYLATHGRKGPVWIDVPLDIQGASVEIDDLIHFNERDENIYTSKEIREEDIRKVFKLMNKAQRPVFLIGHGVVASHREQEIRKLAELFQVPVLATWRAKGVFGDEEPLYMGSPGVPATRYSNYVLQNADFLLIIGTRLNPAITAFDENHFAYNATKVMVDIEREEIEKLDIDFELSIEADAADFIDALIKYKDIYHNCDRLVWLDYCSRMKQKYPLENEIQPEDNEGKVDGFLFANRLSHYSSANDVVVGSSSGRTCGISHMAYRLKKGQRFVTSMGIGAMGWCIPSAIACCIASERKRTLVMEGDGSLQHNIQELALINTYHLPIKIFVFSNGGYASIFSMQRNNFESRLFGCNKDSGLELANIRKVADLYNMPYYHIGNNDEIDSVLGLIMNDNQPCLCEVEASIFFDEIPKSMTIVNSDGSFSSSKLEMLYPFIGMEEQCDNMPEWR